MCTVLERKKPCYGNDHDQHELIKCGVCVKVGLLQGYILDAKQSQFVCKMYSMNVLYWLYCASWSFTMNCKYIVDGFVLGMVYFINQPML